DLGGGISEPVEVLIQNVNPLIKSGSDTAIEISPGSDGEKITRVSTPLPTGIPAQVKSPSVPAPPKASPPPAITTPATPLPSLTPVPTEVPHMVQTTVEPVQPEPTRSPLALIPVLAALILFISLRKR
ncbi:MAG: hypothetical protein LUQ07_08655, partial [Methanospirillum sp.]|nr:hypothetical protein [Methanospirillum sp.]